MKKTKSVTKISDRCILHPVMPIKNEDSGQKCATSEMKTDIVISFYDVRM